MPQPSPAGPGEKTIMPQPGPAGPGEKKIMPQPLAAGRDEKSCWQDFSSKILPVKNLARHRRTVIDAVPATAVLLVKP